MSRRRRIIIVGAAGRDFHNFNVAMRDDASVQVVAFTAAQIPNIDDRRYPPSLAGEHYPEGIPIVPEASLEQQIADHQVDEVIFAYSDVTHEHVMHIGSRALAAGADFRLMGPNSTMLDSTKPVVAICAVRTGSGKSQTTRAVAAALRNGGKKVAVVRHPMPYGDIEAQRVQRFERYEDFERFNCTIEEREEYEPHIDEGNLVFAGVDYEQILREAETAADVVVWDGGNNDLPFFRPDVHICVVDPHRPGHELRYHPGETNLRRADVVVVNKIDSAPPPNIDQVIATVHEINPNAELIRAQSPIEIDTGNGQPLNLDGKRVLCVEDGPTLTHGDMTYGAAVLAAERAGAEELIDPREFAVGAIAETFRMYPNIGTLLPAMGYGDNQMRDLEQTINSCNADVVLIGTPIDLGRLLNLDRPAMRVTYRLQELGSPNLSEIFAARGLI